MRPAQPATVRALDALIEELRKALSPGDIEAGWTERARLRWLPWIEEACAVARSGKLPNVGLARAMYDTHGVRGRTSSRTPLTNAVYEAAGAIDRWGNPITGQESPT